MLPIRKHSDQEMNFETVCYDRIVLLIKGNKALEKRASDVAHEAVETLVRLSGIDIIDTMSRRDKDGNVVIFMDVHNAYTRSDVLRGLSFAGYEVQ